MGNVIGSNIRRDDTVGSKPLGMTEGDQHVVPFAKLDAVRGYAIRVWATHSRYQRVVIT